MKPPVITTAKQPRPAITPVAVIKDVLKSAVSRGPVLGAMVRPALLTQFWPLADHLRKQLSDSFKSAVSLAIECCVRRTDGATSSSLQTLSIRG